MVGDAIILYMHPERCLAMRSSRVCIAVCFMPLPSLLSLPPRGNHSTAASVPRGHVKLVAHTGDSCARSLPRNDHIGDGLKEEALVAVRPVVLKNPRLPKIK